MKLMFIQYFNCLFLFYKYKLYKRKMTDNTRSKNDDCYKNNRDESNYNRLKFSTTSFTDLINAQQTGSYFGSTVRHEFTVPSDKIDIYSELLNGVRPGCCYQVRGTDNPLPLPTLPAMYNTAHGDISTEDNNVRGNNIRLKNPLRYVPDNIERTFGIFDSMIKPSNYVENSSRNGQQTRF
jgi:hypothetical protein